MKTGRKTNNNPDRHFLCYIRAKLIGLKALRKELCISKAPIERNSSIGAFIKQ